VWVRQTVPMVMLWMGLFVMLRMMASWLVDGLKLSTEWKLLDLWNDLYLCGISCLGARHDTVRPEPQPEFWQGWLTVGCVCVVCAVYLRRRIQAVEIVS